MADYRDTRRFLVVGAACLCTHSESARDARGCNGSMPMACMLVCGKSNGSISGAQGCIWMTLFLTFCSCTCSPRSIASSKCASAAGLFASTSRVHQSYTIFSLKLSKHAPIFRVYICRGRLALRISVSAAGMQLCVLSLGIPFSRIHVSRIHVCYLLLQMALCSK